MLITLFPCSCGTKGCDHLICSRRLWKSWHFGSFADMRIYGRKHVCAVCPNPEGKKEES